MPFESFWCFFPTWLWFFQSFPVGGMRDFRVFAARKSWGNGFPHNQQVHRPGAEGFWICLLSIVFEGPFGTSSRIFRSTNLKIFRFTIRLWSKQSKLGDDFEHGLSWQAIFGILLYFFQITCCCLAPMADDPRLTRWATWPATHFFGRYFQHHMVSLWGTHKLSGSIRSSSTNILKSVLATE